MTSLMARIVPPARVAARARSPADREAPARPYRLGVSISAMRARTIRATSSSGIGWSGVKRIVPLAELEPGELGAEWASRTGGAHREERAVGLRGRVRDQRPAAVAERRCAVADGLDGVGRCRRDRARAEARARPAARAGRPASVASIWSWRPSRSLGRAGRLGDHQSVARRGGRRPSPPSERSGSPGSPTSCRPGRRRT